MQLTMQYVKTTAFSRSFQAETGTPRGRKYKLQLASA